MVGYVTMGQDWRDDDGIFFTFCGWLGVNNFSRVGYADDINDNTVQLWMTSD